MHVLLVSYLKNQKQLPLRNDAKSQINAIQYNVVFLKVLPWDYCFSLYILMIFHYVLNLMSTSLLMTQY